MQDTIYEIKNLMSHKLSIISEVYKNRRILANNMHISERFNYLVLGKRHFQPPFGKGDSTFQRRDTLLYPAHY